LSVKVQKCIGLSGFKVQKCIPKKPYSEENGGFRVWSRSTRHLPMNR
jgi:hypothetical protein